MLFVMSMNPLGNQAPRSPPGNQAPRRPNDYTFIDQSYIEQRVTSTVIDPRVNPQDVLCGRGKSSFTHVGNRRFRDAITNSIDEYNSRESRMGKSKVVQKIVAKIKAEGGRFLKRDRSTGRWVELDPKSCRDKVGHAIRDAANLIESRKQKTERKKEIFAQIEQQRGKTTGLEEATDVSQHEESKRPSFGDDDDILYGSASESKHERVEPAADDDDDPFLQHINEVLGPLPHHQQDSTTGRSAPGDFMDTSLH